MPSKNSLLVLLLLNATAWAQPLPPLPAPQKGPPGSIEILPQRPTPTITPPPRTTGEPGARVVYYADPDKPGFLVVRPQGSAVATLTPGVPGSPSEPLPRPRTDIPHLEIIRPTPGAAMPIGNPMIPAIPQEPGKEPAKPPLEEKEPVLIDTWDAAYVRGLKVGYFHTVAREVTKDGKKIVLATKEMRLKVARFGKPVEIWGETTTIETPEGAVLGTVMRQGIGKDQVLVIRGEVQNGKLKITVQGPAENTKEIAWPDGVIGLSREATILKEKKLRTGESIGYSLFESQLTTIVRYTATAGKIEEIKLAAGEKPRRMMPVKVEMEAIENFKLPPGIVWVDPTTYEQLRLDQDMPQFGGMMTILRSTQEVALRPAGRLLDLAEVQSILLEREVPNWDTAQSMTFRFQLGGDLPLNSAFVSDSRQTVKIVDEKERILELTITAERKPKPAVAPGERPGKEYLDPNYFIDWDQDLVKKHARSAIEQLPAGATDWQKAQAIEKWVRNNMRAVEFSQAMASCSNVAKNLTGDCTEFSMLAAGMCRSLGIPARTAVGLVYAAPSQTNPKPMLAWHMWYEVWIEGQWLALDGTLGQGSVGAAHLKVTQASWHDERSIKPLLPIVNLLGTAPKVEILKVDGR